MLQTSHCDASDVTLRYFRRHTARVNLKTQQFR